jgi:Ca-activated chloride channel homolog
VPVPPDPASLEQIAEVSGGQAFSAQDAAGLAAVYENLGSRVSTEEQPQEITAAFAGGALLFVALAVLASLSWFGRVP